MKDKELQESPGRSQLRVLHVEVHVEQIQTGVVARTILTIVPYASAIWDAVSIFVERSRPTGEGSPELADALDSEGDWDRTEAS